MAVSDASSMVPGARHKTRLDRKLRSPQTQRLFRHIKRNPVNLEHDTARLHARGPKFRRSLALTHADFGRLRRHRHVRENPDPDATRTLHVTCDRAARRLDLPCRDTGRLLCLEAKRPKVEIHSALGLAMDPALMSLPEFGALRLQHDRNSLRSILWALRRALRGDDGRRCPRHLP